MNSLVDFYGKKKYKEVFRYFRPNDFTITDLYILLCSLFETGNFDSYSLVYKQYSVEIDKISDSSRVLGYNGLYSYMKGEYGEALINFEKASNIKGEYSDSASSWKKVLDLSSFTPICVNKINYHFDSAVDENSKKEFIKKYESSYERLFKIFCIPPEKNIDVYIYCGWFDSIGNRLSYANPKLMTIHVNIDDDFGHELTHILSSKSYSVHADFVNEGMAEYFDELRRGYLITGSTHRMKLSELWDEFEKFSKDESYLIAKLFFSEMYKYYDYDLKKAKSIIESTSYMAACKAAPFFFNTIDRKISKLLYKLIKRNMVGDRVYVHSRDLGDE